MCAVVVAVDVVKTTVVLSVTDSRRHRLLGPLDFDTWADELDGRWTRLSESRRQRHPGGRWRMRDVTVSMERGRLAGDLYVSETLAQMATAETESGYSPGQTFRATMRDLSADPPHASPWVVSDN